MLSPAAPPSHEVSVTHLLIVGVVKPPEPPHANEGGWALPQPEYAGDSALSIEAY
jgi:hypothetical protein